MRHLGIKNDGELSKDKMSEEEQQQGLESAETAQIEENNVETVQQETDGNPAAEQVSLDVASENQTAQEVSEMAEEGTDIEQNESAQDAVQDNAETDETQPGETATEALQEPIEATEENQEQAEEENREEAGGENKDALDKSPEIEPVIKADFSKRSARFIR